jgi:CAAX protease family protein
MFRIARHYPVSAGLVVMFACTWPIDRWAMAASRGWVAAPPPILPLLVGCGFVVAAILMTGIVDGRGGVRTLLRRFLIWRAGVRWYLVVLLGPLMIYAAAVGMHLALGGRLEEPLSQKIVGPEMSLGVALPVFFLFGVITNGEEIGWRGYALPRLQARHGALVASVVIGCVSAFWHVPKLLTEGGPGYPIWLFVLDAMAKAVLFTWIFINTGGSLLIVTLLHASVNTAEVFLPIIPTVGSVRPFALSVGLLGLAAIIVIVTNGLGAPPKTPESSTASFRRDRRGWQR